MFRLHPSSKALSKRPAVQSCNTSFTLQHFNLYSHRQQHTAQHQQHSSTDEASTSYLKDVVTLSPALSDTTRSIPKLNDTSTRTEVNKPSHELVSLRKYLRNVLSDNDQSMTFAYFSNLSEPDRRKLTADEWNIILYRSLPSKRDVALQKRDLAPGVLPTNSEYQFKTITSAMLSHGHRPAISTTLFIMKIYAMRGNFTATEEIFSQYSDQLHTLSKKQANSLFHCRLWALSSWVHINELIPLNFKSQPSRIPIHRNPDFQRSELKIVFDKVLEEFQASELEAGQDVIDEILNLFLAFEDYEFFELFLAFFHGVDLQAPDRIHSDFQSTAGETPPPLSPIGLRLVVKYLGIEKRDVWGMLSAFEVLVFNSQYTWGFQAKKYERELDSFDGNEDDDWGTAPEYEQPSSSSNTELLPPQPPLPPTTIPLTSTASTEEHLNFEPITSSGTPYVAPSFDLQKYLSLLPSNPHPWIGQAPKALNITDKVMSALLYAVRINSSRKPISRLHRQALLAPHESKAIHQHLFQYSLMAYYTKTHQDFVNYGHFFASKTLSEKYSILSNMILPDHKPQRILHAGLFTQLRTQFRRKTLSLTTLRKMQNEGERLLEWKQREMALMRKAISLMKEDKLNLRRLDRMMEKLLVLEQKVSTDIEELQRLQKLWTADRERVKVLLARTYSRRRRVAFQNRERSRAVNFRAKRILNEREEGEKVVEDQTLGLSA